MIGIDWLTLCTFFLGVVPPAYFFSLLREKGDICTVLRFCAIEIFELWHCSPSGPACSFLIAFLRLRAVQQLDTSGEHLPVLQSLL